MPLQHKRPVARLFANTLIAVAPMCKRVYRAMHRARHEDHSKHVIILISRPLDIELLLGLHARAKLRKDLHLVFWVSRNCVKKYPDILDQLASKGIHDAIEVSFLRLGDVLLRLMSADAFLSVIESSTARHKLPYIITELANAVDVSTYTLQHGFENVGLTYRDTVHGAEVRFSAKTLLSWGPKEGLPNWVSQETRDKVIAVGCPKGLVIIRNEPKLGPGEQPIIGVFDNLHWHRYDKQYIGSFLDHLEEVSKQYRNFCFILKSHPESVRTRSKELTARLNSIKNLVIADMHIDRMGTVTTHWLLSRALGIITTPSTVALDGALAEVPVAVARYGLDLSYYTPLTLLDGLDDWQNFLDQLGDDAGYRHFKNNGERFLGLVNVSGDPATRILDLMVGQ